MRRRVLALIPAAVLLAIAAAAAVVTASAAKQPASATSQSPVGTAKVLEGELSATVSVDGVLTYRAQADGSPYSVVNQARGTYSELPAVGQVISQGHALYRVDGSPVVLLYGSTPAYQTLTEGMAGPDAAELNADLVALGYATRAQLDPKSPDFGAATAVALDKLQASLGLGVTGTLPLGQAVFEPAALRVTSLLAPLGASATPGQSILQATSTARQVQVALDASQQTDVAAGDKVTITLPDNRITTGVVSSVGAVATCPSSPASGGPGAAQATPGSDACSSGGPGSASPTITADVTPSDPRVTGRWDQAPVKVGITTAKVANALSVPVTALLAQASGGYWVEVVGPGGRHHLVKVSPGLFDDGDGLVQVSGPGLSAGQEVVIAST
jgi:hypothetical protein